MKGSVLKKFLCTCLVTAAAFAATTISASACTTIYVGGDLVEEGTPFVARTEDYGSDYNKLWFISESGKWKQGDHYVGCPEYGPFEWDFTHDSYRFTYFTNDIYYDGICPECGEKADHYSYTEFGTNEKGVSVSATETLYGNEKVTEADPYRDAEWAEANKSERIGIEETDIPTIILAEASSAREGVKLLLDIYENYGCVAASGVFVCDKDEAWYVENCSGTQYVAIKLNDNMIFLEPNMAVIGRVDLDDENVIASKDLIAVAKKAGTFVGDEAKNIIDFRASYARISEKMDQRMIDGLNYLNATYKYDSDALVADNTKFTISNLDASDKLVALYTNIKADRKLDKDDVFGYYKLSSIGKASNQEIEIFQLFKDRPVETATVGWVGVGNMSYNVFVPYYPMLIDGMYKGYQVSTASAKFTTEKPDTFCTYGTSWAQDAEGNWQRVSGFKAYPSNWKDSYYFTFEGLCSATRFLRNSDRILEKKVPVLRNISEARSLASAAPKTAGRPTQEGGLFRLREGRLLPPLSLPFRPPGEVTLPALRPGLLRAPGRLHWPLRARRTPSTRRPQAPTRCRQSRTSTSCRCAIPSRPCCMRHVLRGAVSTRGTPRGGSRSASTWKGSPRASGSARRR